MEVINLWLEMVWGVIVILALTALIMVPPYLFAMRMEEKHPRLTVAFCIGWILLVPTLVMAVVITYS